LREFISEDDLNTLEGFLRSQAVDPATITPEELEMWRGFFDEVTLASSANRKVGLMKPPSGKLYGVAAREGSDLWLTLWIRRSDKGDVYVMSPVAGGRWDPHTSYHRDGNYHDKSHGQKCNSRRRQPLTGTFSGTENIGNFGGHSPKSVGAVCDPSFFSGVVEVPTGMLGPRSGWVMIDLVAPDSEPTPLYTTLVQREVFRDAIPWIVITIHV
jgi:hypothetical protein